VKDPSNSQLEVTLWDESSNGPLAEKFLGEVILNLAKLVPYNNTLIEQVFEIKEGKSLKAVAEDKKASGKLKLGLKLVIPDDAAKVATPKAAAPAPPAPAAPPTPPGVGGWGLRYLSWGLGFLILGVGGWGLGFLIL
jgi:hypothetical protein